MRFSETFSKNLINPCRVKKLILHRLARREVGARPPFWTAPHFVSSAVRKMMG